MSVGAMSRGEFRFRGGRLCLDFVATLAGRYRGGTERLGDPADLGRWLRLAMPLDSDAPAASDDLRQAVELREAIYRLVHPATRERPNRADIDIVNTWASRRGFGSQLGADARSMTLRAACPVEAGLATVARDAVDLLSGPWLDRVRECARADCSLLFADLSRPGQRRWCDMKSCGNRMKVRRHRLSHIGTAPV
ncbi:MAG TPA: ABATE domain-containing protein [Streptosporangiaceae bacterium]|nr:ABATE domain-containing protein [Streptosporangiaceae bacterium]